jgi:hypothetical protein
MDYIQLKDIVGEKSFNIIHQLINKPRLRLYLKNNDNITDSIGISDPLENDVVEMNDVISGEPTFIKEIDCIYTYDKTLALEDDNSLGTKYTLTVYMRFDDVPEEILENKKLVIVQFNSINYESVDIQDAYGIIIQANLSI